MSVKRLSQLFTNSHYCLVKIYERFEPHYNIFSNLFQKFLETENFNIFKFSLFL